MRPQTSHDCRTENNRMSNTKIQNLNSEILKFCDEQKSTRYFFEIFRKDFDAQIQLKVPDTLLLFNGNIDDWYRTGSDDYLLRMYVESKMSTMSLFEEILEIKYLSHKREDKYLLEKGITARYVDTYYYRKKSGNISFDSALENHPPIAVLKFHGDLRNYFVGPLELYTNLMENRRILNFLQVLVPSRGSQLGSHIICEILFSSDKSTSICLIYKLIKIKDAHGEPKKEKIRSFDSDLNAKLEEISSRVVTYYQTAFSKIVRKIVCKFILSYDQILFFIGCKKLYTSKEPLVCKPSKIMKSVIDMSKHCQGDFCDYKIFENIKYDLWKKRQRPEVKSFFSLIAKPEKASSSKPFFFELPFFHLKKVREYRTNVAIILLKNRIFSPKDDEFDPSEDKHRQALLASLPEVLRGDTLQNSYQKILVCPKCFSIYELISKEMELLTKKGVEEYFHTWNEIEENIRKKLENYYKYGTANGDSSPIKSEKEDGITSPHSSVAMIASEESSEIGSPIHLIRSNFQEFVQQKKEVPHYMLPSARTQKSLESFTSSQKDFYNKRNPEIIQGIASVSKTIVSKPSTARKFNQPIERVVFRNTASQVRDTKLYMGLPSGQITHTEIASKPSEHSTEYCQELYQGEGKIDLFDQEEEQIDSNALEVPRRFHHHSMTSDYLKVPLAQNQITIVKNMSFSSLKTGGRIASISISKRVSPVY